MANAESINRPKISIIVPVYKAESYIHRCIDSILIQTLTDWELLLIDDGSPDNSGKICDEYANKDSRVRVIHKKNEGVSSARQAGLDDSSGEYTIHIDPDDWVEPNMLEELYNKAKIEDADMVICDFFYEYKCGRIICAQNITECNADAILKQMFAQQLHGSCWNKLIRRECFYKYNISFPKNIIRWEDLYVICSLLMHPIKVAYLSKAFYHYDQIINSNSIVRKVTRQGLDSQILFIEHFRKIGCSVDLLYPSMRATKELAYYSGVLETNQIVSLFSEINNRYISEQKGLFDFVPKGLTALIKGQFMISFFYKSLQFLWLLKKKII